MPAVPARRVRPVVPVSKKRALRYSPAPLFYAVMGYDA